MQHGCVSLFLLLFSETFLIVSTVFFVGMIRFCRDIKCIPLQYITTRHLSMLRHVAWSGILHNGATHFTEHNRCFIKVRYLIGVRITVHCGYSISEQIKVYSRPPAYIIHVLQSSAFFMPTQVHTHTYAHTHSHTHT